MSDWLGGDPISDIQEMIRKMEGGMSDVLPTPIKRKRERAVLVLRRNARDNSLYRNASGGEDLVEVANWIESMGDEPEKADSGGKGSH